MCVLVVVMVTFLSGGNYVRVSGSHGNSPLRWLSCVC